MFVVPDRSRAFAGADDRHIDQSDAGPSRSPRDDGALRGGQGAAGRRRGNRARRRRRRLLPRHRRAAHAKSACRISASRRSRRSARSIGAFTSTATTSCSARRTMRRKRRRLLCSLKGARALRGAHNAQNAVFAAAACWELGLEDEEIARGLLSFPGLPHRMEEVARLGHVIFVNDSKATNADAASKALASYIDIYWIIGGKAKEGGIESLRAFFPLIVKAYLIGEASDDFASDAGGRRALRALRDAGSRDGARGARRGARARHRLRSCCFRRPAPHTINSPISKRAETPFASLAQKLAASGLGRRLMISRAHRTPLSDWAWTIDRWLARRHRHADRRGTGVLDGGQPAGGRAAASADLLFRQSAGAVSAAGACSSCSACRCCRRATFAASRWWCSSYRWRWSSATLFFGQEVKGARRWIFGIQPSEFLKPAFVVLVAWAFSEGAARKGVPGNIIALALFPLDRRAAGAPAGLWPDHADLDGLGDPVLHGGAALAVGRRHWRARRVLGSARL